MPRRIHVTAARALVFVLVAAPAWSWGFTGHHIIAMIAEKRLSPAVREKIQKLLMDGTYSLVDISTCADRIRDADRGSARPEDRMCRAMAGTAPATNGTWHYIQIPIPTNAKTLDAFCPQGDCVTAKITSFAETLRTSKDEAQRRRALLFLVHLLGDIHQPLHVVDCACDQGGNSEKVGFSMDGREYSDVSLHHVWDTAEIDLLMADSKVADERAMAAALIAAISPVDAEKWAKATPEQVAWESYRIAIRKVYPAIPYQDFCDDQQPSHSVIDLSLAYEEEGTKVVQLQLMKAGVRLAAILESALGRP